MSDASAVAMAKEEVVITLHDGFAVVDASFQMRNRGKTSAINVGFPGQGVIVMGNGYRANRPLIGFTAWVDGKKTDAPPKTHTIVTRMGPPGRQYEKRRDETWHVFHTNFPGGATTAIRVRYAVLADPFRGDSWRGGETFLDGTVNYTLSTGAGWAGKIGEAIVRVRTAGNVPLQLVRIRDGRMPRFAKVLDPSQTNVQLPNYAEKSATEVVLTRSSFEPTLNDNLEIVYRWTTPRLDWRDDPQDAAKTQKAATEAAAAIR